MNQKVTLNEAIFAYIFIVPTVSNRASVMQCVETKKMSLCVPGFAFSTRSHTKNGFNKKCISIDERALIRDNDEFENE